MDSHDWLGTVQAGIELDVSDGRVRQLIYQGKLEATRFGHRLYVRKGAVQALKEQRAGKRTWRYRHVDTETSEKLRELCIENECSIKDMVARLVAAAWADRSSPERPVHRSQPA